MDDDALVARAERILGTILYATVATCSKDNLPWNSPVRCVRDDNLHFYWFSDKESQHSRNVRGNSHVFLVIYDSTVPEGQGAGVYVQAKAYEVSDPEEITLARRIKKGASVDRPADDFLGTAVRRVYKAVPERIWTNAAEIKDGVFVRDYRIEVPLDLLKSRLKKST